MHHTDRHRNFPVAQRGAVLVVALILLLVMTVLGVTGMRSAFLEERMTGNTQDLNIAFESGEAALRVGEALLRQPVLPDFSGADGLHQPADAEDLPVWETVDWGDTNAVLAYTDLDDAPGKLSRAEARYLIEELPPITSPGESLAADTPIDEGGFYRITARGVGTNGTTIVMLQTTYRR